MFVDKATIRVKAGRGGDGAVSFRHEKFIGRGGPDGGDGGDGGDIIFKADKDSNTLLNFRHRQELKAEDGQAGAKQKKHGRNGKSVTVQVPVGTVVLHDGESMADLTEDGQQVIVAKGGQGGYGNAHFISSTRQAPRIAELGEHGDEYELQLELKLLADVGLVGLPNAGKSTFLSVVSNARPEIADYPFTTLTPNLGVAPVDDFALLIADIPGLIEGASQGKGLGDEFLRHIERTSVLLHLVDVYNDDIVKAYTTIRGELSTYSEALSQREEIIAITKTEHLDDNTLQEKIQALQTVAKNAQIFTISALTREGITEVLRALRVAVVASKETQQAIDEEETVKIPVIELSAKSREQAWNITVQDHMFIIKGKKIERFAARTRFDSDDGVRRLRDIMRKMGIMHELERQGIEQGDIVRIGEKYSFEY